MDAIEKDVEAVRRIGAVPSILKVISETTGMRFVAIARVTASRWIACEVLDKIAFGLTPGTELPIETTICNEVRHLQTEVVIDHVAEDPAFRSHHTPRLYGFQSYVSVPIILPDGEIFGTLCAIDPEPRPLKGKPAGAMFRLFANLIALHLDASFRLEACEKSLVDSRVALATSQNDLATSAAHLQASQEEGELREQFIVVLGHDLRNPLASFQAGTRMLSKEEADPKKLRLLRLMNEGIARMNGLVDNLLDFARGRLGEGIGLDLTRGARIEPVLARIVNEITSTYPERTIRIDFELTRTVDVDPARIGQMLSNLLGNAITHGDPDQDITVTSRIVGDAFELSVCNGGEAIPEAARAQLFQPFYRGQVRPSQQGLGLGLYIASEIARAHDGTLSATSDDRETCFTFRMPIQAQTA